MDDYFDPDQPQKLRARFAINTDKNSTADSQEWQFDMYLLRKELRTAIDQLEVVAAFPIENRQVWLEENKEMLDEYLHELVTEVMSLFDATELTGDLIADSIECISELRMLLNTLQPIYRSPSDETMSQKLIN